MARMKKNFGYKVLAAQTMIYNGSYVQDHIGGCKTLRDTKAEASGGLNSKKACAKKTSKCAKKKNYIDRAGFIYHCKVDINILIQQINQANVPAPLME